MENITDKEMSVANMGFEDVLEQLESLSNSMNQLALETQLRQCDLILCIGSPENLLLQKMKEVKHQHRAGPPSQQRKGVSERRAEGQGQNY
ncbi:uncharacterized protein LOC103391392 isoform X2 [Cynoglossus semilaevis]|uniref:uncharacterized protein LOC103391392 isoform X2 n=1 Tax=Cynoglossus semilaevis TaxID=244447 RepID=UPI000D629949|nr:uncharacterized protein LOC103391392 isoform X2 [Cynoglossus semilaevis]